MKEFTALTRDPQFRFMNEIPKTEAFNIPLGCVESIMKIYQHYKDEGRMLIAIAGEREEKHDWLYTTRSFIDYVDEQGNEHSDLVDEYVDTLNLKVNLRVRMLVASTK